ncbi:MULTISPECIES: hypothetical protein [Haloferacaceae]|uniref:hypothetical protein n=1 Tax=Haloferacaceae TaxID=1644056 RepID=UPI001EEF8AA3|nr:hypothetical protein [Halobellus captivus]
MNGSTKPVKTSMAPMKAPIPAPTTSTPAPTPPPIPRHCSRRSWRPASSSRPARTSGWRTTTARRSRNEWPTCGISRVRAGRSRPRPPATTPRGGARIRIRIAGDRPVWLSRPVAIAETAAAETLAAFDVPSEIRAAAPNLRPDVSGLW